MQNPLQKSKDAHEDSQKGEGLSQLQYHTNRCKFTNLLPLLFVIVVIVTLYTVYEVCHIQPLFQFGKPHDAVDADALWRGRVHALIFNVLTVLMLICYVRSIFVHPGGVPNTPEWLLLDWEQLNTDEARQGVKDSQMRETKRTGERRYCKWCGRYKPDRCHHCRVCKQCVLRMDHHCPWIVNCVGFRNHKFFFLLVFYSALDCIFISTTMMSSVERAINEETPFGTMFMLVFGETLAILMGLLVTVFFSFHVWLMSRATTTIEFCEKSSKGDGTFRSLYDMGLYRNVLSVLGPKPLLWLLPWFPPTGDGLSFPSGEVFW